MFLTLFNYFIGTLINTDFTIIFAKMFSKSSAAWHVHFDHIELKYMSLILKNINSNKTHIWCLLILLKLYTGKREIGQEKLFLIYPCMVFFTLPENDSIIFQYTTNLQKKLWNHLGKGRENLYKWMYNNQIELETLWPKEKFDHYDQYLTMFAKVVDCRCIKMHLQVGKGQ